jgi:hypothetical protein
MRDIKPVVLCAAWLMVASSVAQRTAVDTAVDTVGADSAKTLEFTASGATFTVGQNFTPNDPWPRVTLKRYTVAFDYEHSRVRQEYVRQMGATMPRGGGVPFTGELQQMQLSDAQSAWDIPVGTDPSAGSLPACGRGRRNRSSATCWSKRSMGATGTLAAFSSRLTSCRSRTASRRWISRSARSGSTYQSTLRRRARRPALPRHVGHAVWVSEGGPGTSRDDDGIA